MRKIFFSLGLSLLLPLSACGVDAPAPQPPAGSASRTTPTGLYVPDDGDPGGGKLDKCAAAECNDRDRRKDYVDPPPDDELTEAREAEAREAEAQVARTR